MKQIINGESRHILLETTREQDALLNSARLLRQKTMSRFMHENGYLGQLWRLQTEDINMSKREQPHNRVNVSLQLPSSITGSAIDCLSGALEKSRIMKRLYSVDSAANEEMLAEYWQSVEVNP